MRAKILGFCNKKGGTGKTTLAVNVGATLAENAKVLIIDADPQLSVIKWKNAAAQDSLFPIEVMKYHDENVHLIIREKANQYDYILVDTPPSGLAVSKITRSALIGADLALIPVLPSPLDVWETMTIADLFTEINKVRKSSDVPPIEARFVIYRAKARTSLCAEIKGVLESIGYPVLETMIHERECHKHAVLAGCTILTLRDSRASTKAAVREIRSLTEEIVTIIGG